METKILKMKVKQLRIMCGECKKRVGIIRFAEEPIFALTHGFGSCFICRECYIKKIEVHLNEIKTNLKQQRKLLKNEKVKKCNTQQRAKTQM